MYNESTNIPNIKISTAPKITKETRAILIKLKYFNAGLLDICVLFLKNKFIFFIFNIMIIDINDTKEDAAKAINTAETAAIPENIDKIINEKIIFVLCNIKYIKGVVARSFKAENITPKKLRKEFTIINKIANNKGRKISGLLNILLASTWDKDKRIIAPKKINIVSILRKYQKYEKALIFLFFPKNSDTNLTVVWLIPKSVNEKIITAIERTREYTPNNSGSNALAKIIVRIKPPNLAIIVEEKL